MTDLQQALLDKMPRGRELTRHALGKPALSTISGLIRAGLVREIKVPPSRRWPRGTIVYKRVA